MAFTEANICPVHNCPLTGFITLFCARCEQEKSEPAVQEEKSSGDVYYLFTFRAVDKDKTEIPILTKGTQLYESVSKLEQDINRSRIASSFYGTGGKWETRIWKVPRKTLEPYKSKSTNIYAVGCINSDIVGVTPAEFIKDY